MIILGDSMKRKTKIFLIVSIISLVLTVGSVLVIVPYLFSEQYNSYGISHFLVVTIDNSPKKYIGDLEDHKVYIEKLNEEGTVFRSIDAKNVSIKEALDKKLVSIEDWEKYAFRVVKKANYKILKYDNYEIYIDSEVCVIRPLTK